MGVNIPLDVTIYMFKYMDIQSIKDTLLSSKAFGEIFFVDKDLVKRIVFRKLIEYSKSLGLNAELIQKSNGCFVLDKELILSLSKFQDYFGNKSTHPFTYLQFLCRDASHKKLFSAWCSHISDNKIMGDVHVANLLLHCHNELLEVIFDNWIVPSRTIYHIMYAMIKERAEGNTGKLKALIDYFLMKYHFPSFNYGDKSYFYYMLDVLMEYNPDLFMYMFEKKSKYNFKLDYNHLINKAITIDDPILLTRIHMEQLHDLNRLGGDTLQSMIVIDPRSIRDMIEKGEFRCLRYILKYMLDKYINAPAYMLQICTGLQNLHERCVPIKATTLEVLFKYLDRENTLLIKSKLWGV